MCTIKVEGPSLSRVLTKSCIHHFHNYRWELFHCITSQSRSDYTDIKSCTWNFFDCHSYVTSCFIRLIIRKRGMKCECRRIINATLSSPLPALSPLFIPALELAALSLILLFENRPQVPQRHGGQNVAHVPIPKNNLFFLSLTHLKLKGIAAVAPYPHVHHRGSWTEWASWEFA